ncbi:MAG: AMP-binding protein [Comamonadaceae bacterium]|nr:AMP-binding protein [Comamonadaceae bacterium]
MMATCPLSTHAPDSVIAWTATGAVTTAQYCADVMRLAAQLATQAVTTPAAAGQPPQRFGVLNTCQDRYGFMVGLGAALVQGAVTLMPANLTPVVLRQLAQSHGTLLNLHDGHARAEGVPGLHVAPVARQGDAAPMPHIPANQLAVVAFTSGSTGTPTAHAKHWGALCLNGANEAARLNAAGRAIVATVPAQHMYGFESSVLMTLHGGASLWHGRPFYSADIAAALASVPRPRMLVTTPFHLSNFIASELTPPPCDLLLCATAPLHEALAERGEALFGAPLFEIYGCTESGQIASRRLRHDAAWQLLPGVEMHVETGAEAQNHARTGPGMADEPGNAWVHGGHVEGRVALSDRIQPLPDGRFLLRGRHADMVNIAGKRASLASLSAQLRAIPGVTDGCFLLPESPADPANPAGVTRLAALVVAPGLNSAQVRHALRQAIDPVFLPRPLVFVNALPRNATGKLVLADLQRLLPPVRRNQRQTG